MHREDGSSGPNRNETHALRRPHHRATVIVGPDVVERFVRILDQPVVERVEPFGPVEGDVRARAGQFD
jgi:hypothetical protein